MLNKHTTLSLLAPAKLNLFLNVINKLPNGYHHLFSFITFINLFDHIDYKVVNKTKNSLCSLVFSAKSNPLLVKNLKTYSQKNIIEKVVDYMFDKFNIQYCIEIIINKQIPIGGGLGGGSSDAATTIFAINDLFNLQLSPNELMQIGSKFGADVPLCLNYHLHHYSGLFKGTGRVINNETSFTPQQLKFQLPMLLINPNIGTYTKKVFGINKVISGDVTLQKHAKQEHDNKEDFLKFICQQNNDLTEAALQITPEIQEVLNLLSSTNPAISRMSGSGATCFAVYNSNKELYLAKKNIEEHIRKVEKDYYVVEVGNIK